MVIFTVFKAAECIKYRKWAHTAFRRMCANVASGLNGFKLKVDTETNSVEIRHSAFKKAN